MQACHGDGDPTNNTPRNLRWGTVKASIADQKLHGTHASQITQCRRSGHPYTPENTIRNRQGRRVCRACRDDYNASRQAARAKEEAQMTMLCHGKLLVDYEDGRVLRADDEVIVSDRVLDSHPFIETADGGASYSIGPDARRHALARARQEGVASLDAVEYESCGQIAGMITLRKREDG